MDLPESLRRLNEALARVEELAAEKAEIIARYEGKLTQLDAITAAIADPTKNDAATLEAIQEAVAEGKLTDRQRQLIELQQMRSDIDAKIAELEATS